MKKKASTRPKTASPAPRGEYKQTARLLRLARHSQALSQSALAKHFNYHGQHIANWEAGISLPPVETLYKLSQILKIPVKQLIDLRTVELKKKWLQQLKVSKRAI